MHTLARSRLGGRVPAALLSLCLCLASACSEEPGLEIPRGAPLPPLAYTLTPTYASPDTLDRPETITGHLYLDVADDGQVTGTISATALGATGIAMISGVLEGTEIVFQDTEVDPAANSSLELEQFRITLLDTDGDGVADSAEGQASGFWYRGVGDVPDYVMHTSVLTAGPDIIAPTGSLSVSGAGGTLLPYDTVRVRFTEPLREADVRDHLRILANGAPVTGALTLTATAGLATAATLQPDSFLEYGAEVTVESGDLKDPSGNALEPSGESVSVIADPGPLAGNTGFESELTGWLHFGRPLIEGEVEGFAPAEGAAQALLEPGSTLATALDVPAGATEIDLSVTLLSPLEAGEVPAEGTVVITLIEASGEKNEIFDAAEIADQLQECATCTVYNYSVGPLRHTFDLTPLAGQRVFLLVEVDAPYPVGSGVLSLLLDDIQIR